VANGWTPEDEINQIRAELGLPPIEKPSAWSVAVQPVKGALGALGNVGGQLLGLMAPEAYQAAEERLQDELQLTRDANIFERAEALPGLGDVGAELLPEGLRESTVGRITGPVARMVANALGDPTTYTPWILGKAGQAAMKAIPAYQAARAATAAEKAAGFIGPVSEAAQAARVKQALAAGTGIQRAATWMGQHRLPIDQAMAVGGLAYAPEIVSNVGQSAAESWRLAKQGEWGEAATTGAAGMLMAGLAAMIGKGIMDIRSADNMLKEAIAKEQPGLVRAREAAEAGQIPDITQPPLGAEGPLPAFEGQGMLPGMEGLEPRPLPEPLAEPPVAGVPARQTALYGPKGGLTRAARAGMEPRAPGPELEGVLSTDMAPRLGEAPILSQDMTPRLRERPAGVAEPTPQVVEPEGPVVAPAEPPPGAVGPQRIRLPDGTEVDLPLSPEQLSALSPEQLADLREQVRLQQRAEPRTFEEGRPAEPPPPGVPGKARKLTEVEQAQAAEKVPRGPTRRPIEHLPQEEADALRRGEEIAGDMGVEPEGVRRGIEEAIDRVTLDYGKTEEGLAFALKAMRDELGNLRAIARGRRGLLTDEGELRPDVEAGVKRTGEAIEYVQEHGARVRELRKQADERALTAEEQREVTQYKANQELIQDSPLYAEVYRVGKGNEGVTPAQFVKQTIEALEKEDTEALAQRLYDVVQVRARAKGMEAEPSEAAPVRAEQFDARIEDALGKAHARLTNERLPTAVRDANADAIRQMWEGLSGGRKWGYEGEKLTLPDIFQRMLEESDDEADAVGRFQDLVASIARKTGESRIADIRRLEVTREYRPISEVIDEADELDLRYRGERVARADLQQYAAIREEGVTKPAEIAERMGKTEEDLIGLNTLYNDMKSRSVRKIPKEQQMPLTEEGAEVAPDVLARGRGGEVSATMGEGGRDTFAVLEQRLGKTMDEVVDDADDELFQYGKDRRSVDRDELKKYIEARRDGLTGRALSEFMWGKYIPNKLSGFNDVFNNVLGLKKENAKIVQEVNEAADSLWNNFLSGRKVRELDIDDQFTAALARAEAAVRAGEDAMLFGKGKGKGQWSSAWDALREWGGAAKNAGKAKILAGIRNRLETALPPGAATKLKRAELPTLRAELGEAAAATRLVDRLGLLAGSDAATRAGRKLKGYEKGLPSLAEPKHVRTTGALAERFPPGVYSGFTAPGNGRVYFTAAEKSRGETVTVLATRGEGSLANFLSEARRRGTKHLEIPDQLAEGLKGEINNLRREGVLRAPGTRSPNATSLMYPVEPGPPRTAAMVTDAAAIAESTRQWYRHLKDYVEQRGWQESLSKVAGQTVGRGKGYDDLLKRLAVDVATGRNLFRLDARIGMEPYGVIRQLASSLYLHRGAGERVFEDFSGVRSALADVQKQFGIDPATKPMYLANGAHNGVYAIGKDREGRALVMKINAHAPKQLFLEDRVPQAKSFMLPTLRAGTTKEGWNWRVERRGVPMTIERPGIVVPTDVPVAVGAQYLKHQELIRSLEDKGVVKVLDDGPGQWVMVDGKPYLSDRGAIAPMKSPYWNWMAQQESRRKPYYELSPRDQKARDTQWGEAIKNQKNGAVDFDGVMGDEFTGRLGKATEGLADELTPIVDEIQEAARRIEGAENVSVGYAGVTGSPYTRGAYAEGKVYTNPLEVLYQHPDDPRAAAEMTVADLIHEVFHDAVIEHGDLHTPMVDQLRLIADLEGKFDGWVDKVEAVYRKRADALDELMPEYREAAYNAVTTGRESWRGEAGLRTDAVHAAEGGAPRAPYRQGAGPEDLEARGGAGVQRGGVVPEGLRRTPGPLGEAAADRGAYARTPAEGPGVPARGEGEGGGRVAAATTGRGGRTTGGVRDFAEAKAILDDLTKAKRPVSTMMSRALEMSFQLVRRMQDLGEEDRIRELATAKPDRAEWWSRFNLETIQGVSDEAKAAVQLWSQLTRGIPELSRAFKADTPRTWDQIDREVAKLLDAKSKTELYGMLKKNAKGLSDTQMHLAKILGADLLKRVQDTEAELTSAQWRLSKGQGSAEDVAKAELRAQLAAQDFAEGMPAIVNPITETARALAAARKAARAQNPEATMLQDFKASLFERLRKKYKSDQDTTSAVNSLMSLWAEVRNGTKDINDWVDLYRASLKVDNVDKFLEAYKAFLLGWKSRVANIGSNSLVQGMRELERTAAIAMEQVYAKAQGRKPERYWGELKLNSLVARHWAKSALPDWYQSFKDGLAMRPEEFTLERMGSMMEDLSYQVGAIEGTKGEFVRFMFKGMNAEDALFKRASQLQYYYRQVYRNLKEGAEGYKMRPGEDIYVAASRYVDEIEDTWLKKMKGLNPDSKLVSKYQDIHDEGFRIAREETFQAELPEWLKGMQNAMRTGGGRAGQFVFPFVRTPWNIAVETVRRTPAGFWEVAKKWDELGPAERMDMLARPMVGTAVGAMLVNEAMNGNITGGGPLDPVEEANLRETGWRAYSIRVGNQYLGYQRLEPVSSIIGMAADIAEGVKRGDFSTVGRSTNRLFSLVTENLTNKTFLSGLEGLSTAMSDPQRYAGQWIKQMQMSVVPNTIGPIPFGHLTQAIDPVYRQTEPMSLEAFAVKVPFLSKTLAPQYTPTGELRRRPGTAVERLISPLTRTAQRTDPVAVAAQLLDDIGSPPTPPKRYTYVRGVKVYYTPEQRQRLAQAQQRATQIIGSRLVRDPSFMRLPDNEDVAPLGAKTKKDVVKKLYDKYRRAVQASFRADLMSKAARHTGGEYRP